MATLTGSTIASTYKDLLQVSNSNSGVDATARAVSDGEGTASLLYLSTTEVYSPGTGGTSNTAFGKNAGDALAANGNYNVVLGEEAGTALSTADNNVAIGYQAFYRASTGADDCVAIGYNAMSGNFGAVAADDCVAIGSGALAGTLTTGAVGTTVIGKAAGAAITSGQKNTGVGFGALTAETDGDFSVAVGYNALAASTGGDGTMGNTAVGYLAGTALTTGLHNVAVGYNALYQGTTESDDNVAIGYNAMSGAIGTEQVNDCVAIGSGALAGALDSTDGADEASGSVAIGKAAGAAITTGARITALGFEAADALTVGDDNLAIGYKAMTALTSTDGIDKNIAIGNYAMDGATTAAHANNVLIGYGAGGGTWHTSNASTQNVALGNNTLGGAMSSAADNVAVGHNAGAACTTGTTNVLVGSGAGAALTAGNTSIAIGSGALANHTTGNTNIAIGYNAMNNSADNGSTAADSGGNIFIGLNSGGGSWVNATTTGNVALGSNTLNGALNGALSNTCIGPSAGNDMVQNDYCVALGYNAQASGNTATQEITLGDSNIETLRCQETTIAGLSDQRDKTDVEDYPSSGGLNFINKLRPVLFTWDKRQWYGEPDEEYNEENDFPEGHVRENVLGTPDGSKKSAVKDAEHPHGGARMGFLAQELDSAIDEVDAEFMKNMDMVYKSNPDKLETKLGHLITPLIKAVQELSAKVTALENA